MVLKTKPTNQGIRFIVGICIIALSIYGFYLALAGKRSPELFLVPIRVTPEDHPCTDVAFPTFSLCIPSGIHYAVRPDGSVDLQSSSERIRGEIRLMEKLPQEEQWRKSLRRPLIRAFLGDERSMGTHELMEKILTRRYNPTLMGVKSQLIPSWMRHNEHAEILIPSGDEAILFYTPARCLGFRFAEGKIVMFSCVGSMNKAAALSVIHSIRITSAQGAQLSHSS